MKLHEKRHRAGCECGFCRNMGKGFGKKKDEPKKEDKPDQDELNEADQDLGTVRGVATYRGGGDRPFRADYMGKTNDWYIRIYDYSENAWGRSETGVGTGPVIDQGWFKQMELHGWTFPELKQPTDIRGSEMQRLASRVKEYESRAQKAVNRLLEDDIPGGSPAGERHDTRNVDPLQLAMGKKVEREHTKGAPEPAATRSAEEIALDHLTELDPPGKPKVHKNYYSRLKKAGLAPELKKGIGPKPKGSFYPSMGGPSST